MGKKGFTLVELIVVLAIIGILILIVTPFVNGYIYDSKLNEDKAVAADLQNSISTWMNLDRTEIRADSYTHLSNTNKIGGISEVQYYNKYMGTGQLPGTEFTNETDIRKAVLSSMKSILGNSLTVNSNWTIESPKASSLLSYRYYYRTGIVKVVEYTQKEKSDELDGYYITLDKIGYSNIANNSFIKTEDIEVLSTGVTDKTVNLYGLDVSSLGITEGVVSVWDLSTNMKSTINIEDLQESKLFTSGLYYIVGNYKNTVENIKFLLAIDGFSGKCYSFENYNGCNSEYIQKVKLEINTDENEEISLSEIRDFIKADETKTSKKIVMSVGATESNVGFDTNKYIIDYEGIIEPEDEEKKFPTKLNWHIVGDIEYVWDPIKEELDENVPHKIEKENGLKVCFYGDVINNDGLKRFMDIYDWETDVFEVKNTTICLELDSTNSIEYNGTEFHSTVSPDFKVSILAVDETGKETLYDEVLNRGEQYSRVSSEYSNSRTTGVIKLKDGKYKLRTSEVSASRAWLNVYFGEQTTEKLLPEAISKGIMTLEDGIVSFNLDTPTVLSFKYVDWHFNYDYDISATIVINKDYSNYLTPRVNGKTSSTIVLTPGYYQIGLVKGKEGNEGPYSQSTAKIFDIVETIPTTTMITDNCLSSDDSYGGGYIIKY